jgi:pyruvate carboxylase subunit B
MFQVEIDGKVLIIEMGDNGVTVNDQPADVVYSQSEDNSGHILLNGRSIPFFAEDAGDGTWRVAVDGREYAATVKTRKDLLLEKFGGAVGSSSGRHTIKAPMPGLVLRINVTVGEVVAAGHPLLVLEAMKMENELVSPGGGVVTAIHVADGDAVGKSALLIEIGPEGEA